MAFAPTPARNNAPSQLLPISSLVTSTSGSFSGPPSGSLTIVSPPATGIPGVAMSIAGTVSPGGAPVQIGLSLSASTGPANWISAIVNGTAWTASVTPSGAGTYYIWVREANATSVQAISAPVTVSAGASVAFSAAPTSGVAGTALSIAGSVTPSGTAVQVGLATSATVAPTNWIAATVSGTSWTVSITPSAAGTYYFWAEQTNANSVQAVSAAVTIGSAGGSALTYSLMSGTGNGSLTGTTVETLTSEIYAPDPAVDWTNSIVHGAVDVMPGIYPSSLGAIAACKFWFDSSATNATVPASFGNQASTANGAITFYPYNDGYGTPTCVPAAPSTAGTYYGKYAMYNSGGTLLGIYATSAIIIT